MKRSRSMSVTFVLAAAIAGLVPSSAAAGELPPDVEARRAAMEEHREHMKALSPFSIVGPPPEVEVEPGGSGESDGTYRYWRAKADGAISAVELVEHYAVGLQALGWTFRPTIEEGVVALRTGEYRDPEGAIWHVLVLAAPSFATAGRCIITVHLTQVA